MQNPAVAVIFEIDLGVYPRDAGELPLRTVYRRGGNGNVLTRRRYRSDIERLFSAQSQIFGIFTRSKLKRKNCDLIVLNGPDNVGSDEAVVELFTPEAGWTDPIGGSKTVVARRLIRLIESMWAQRPKRG